MDTIICLNEHFIPEISNMIMDYYKFRLVYAMKKDTNLVITDTEKGEILSIPQGSYAINPNILLSQQENKYAYKCNDYSNQHLFGSIHNPSNYGLCYEMIERRSNGKIIYSGNQYKYSYSGKYIWYYTDSCGYICQESNSNYVFLTNLNIGKKSTDGKDYVSHMKIHHSRHNIKSKITITDKYLTVDNNIYDLESKQIIHKVNDDSLISIYNDYIITYTDTKRDHVKIFNLVSSKETIIKLPEPEYNRAPKTVVTNVSDHGICIAFNKHYMLLVITKNGDISTQPLDRIVYDICLM